MISLSGQTAVLANVAVQREGSYAKLFKAKSLSCGTRCSGPARRMNGLYRYARHAMQLLASRSLELDFVSKVQFW